MEEDYKFGTETNVVVPTDESDGVVINRAPGLYSEFPDISDEFTTKKELRLKAIEAHNVEYERLKNRTKAEREADFKAMVSAIAKKVTGEAHNALFGTHKKKEKRWGKKKKK